jgi:alkylhydroperoxidase family enzyme
VDADALRALAPDAFAAFDAVVASVPTVGTLGGLGDDSASKLLGQFEEQFVVDVAGVTSDQRRAVADALGSELFDFVQSCYVRDFDARMRAAWRQLFDVNGQPRRGQPSASLWEALDGFFTTVARMNALDPITTEIVRLRGAHAHNCRLCKSTRSVRAEAAGATESLYDKIERFEDSDLSDRHKAALRLVDALLWQPTSYPAETAATTHEHFAPAEVVEIVFDVTRNAANKIAVALAADAPHVAEGVEYYDIDPTGAVVYLAAP